MSQPRAGFVAAAVGTSVGAAILGSVGFALGVVWAERYMPDTGLEGLLPALGASVAGLWLGGSVGCYVALRVRRHEVAGRTALILAPLLIVWTLLLAWLQGYVDLDDALVGLPGLTAGVVVVLMVPAIAARAITMARQA